MEFTPSVTLSLIFKFCGLTICNDNPLLIRLCTELDLLPNFERFPLNICDGCGMPTGDAYSFGHLVPSLLNCICSTC